MTDLNTALIKDIKEIVKHQARMQSLWVTAFLDRLPTIHENVPDPFGKGWINVECLNKLKEDAEEILKPQFFVSEHPSFHEVCQAKTILGLISIIELQDKALEFYADKKNWGELGSYHDWYKAQSLDLGAKAREAREAAAKLLEDLG